MPLYEYLCQACGKKFEELQSFKDKPLNKCRFCGGQADRVISQSSFSLKGGGWYKDGYSKQPTQAPKAASTSGTKPSPGGKGPGSSGS